MARKELNSTHFITLLAIKSFHSLWKKIFHHINEGNCLIQKGEKHLVVVKNFHLA
jgi:hypothetical protein